MAKRGPTLAFWINGASGICAFSVFRKGKRLRHRSRPRGADRIPALIDAFLGAPQIDLFEVPFEKFDATR